MEKRVLETVLFSLFSARENHEGGTRSTIEGGRGCNKFVPVLGGDGTKRSSTGDIFDQPPGEMS